MNTDQIWAVVAIAALIALAVAVRLLRGVRITRRHIVVAAVIAVIVSAALFPQNVGELGRAAWQRARTALEAAGGDMPLWLLAAVGVLVVVLIARRRATMGQVVWGLIAAAVVASLFFPTLPRWAGQRLLEAHRQLEAGFALTPEERAAKAAKEAERKAAEERQREAEARSSIRSAYCSGVLEIVKINPIPDEVRKGLFGLEVGRERHPGVNIGEGRETCDLYWAVKALPGLEACADFRSAQGSARWCAGQRGGWVRRDSRNPGLWVRSATGAHGKPALPIEICILPVRAGAQIEDPVGFVMRECNPNL